MKRTSGWAAFLALLAMVAFAPAAGAQLCSGQVIKFDCEAWAWETGYAPYNSAAGSQLKIFGLVSQFCPPFDFLLPNDPNTEYSFYIYGLTTALGTQNTVIGTTTIHSTNYGNGFFEIHAGSPRDAYDCVAATPPPPLPPGPPDALTVGKYTDGPIIISGTLTNFRTTVTETPTTAYGNFRSDYQFTGGTLYYLVQDTGTGIFGGNWDPLFGFPAGYSAHPNGKWDTPPTGVHPSTWGALKLLYR